jgi:hypothetical protein
MPYVSPLPYCLVVFLSRQNVLAACGRLTAQRASLHSIIQKKQKTAAPRLALEYFDFFYGASFGDEWHRARLAMLNEQRKYAALVNNYADWPSTLSQLESLTALNMYEFALRHRELIRRPTRKSKQQRKLWCPCHSNFSPSTMA